MKKFLFYSFILSFVVLTAGFLVVGTKTAILKGITGATISIGLEVTGPITDIVVSNITDTEADIAWRTPREASLCTLYVGETVAYEFGSFTESVPVVDHLSSLAALSPETVYHYKIACTDSVHGVQETTDATFETLPSPNIPITSVTVSPLTDIAATVNWNTTGYPATCSLLYGETIAYELGTLMESGPSESHSLNIPSLNPSTTYHYKITCDDGILVGETLDATFVTLAPSAIPLDNISVSAITMTSADINWDTTGVSSLCSLEYGTTTGYEIGTLTESIPAVNHSQSLSGLSAGTTYHYKISCDAGIRHGETTDRTFTTLFTNSVTLSGVEVVGIKSTIATVRFATTGVSSTCTVDYGQTSAYELGTLTENISGTEHSIRITGLSSNTVYQYRITCTAPGYADGIFTGNFRTKKLTRGDGGGTAIGAETGEEDLGQGEIIVTFPGQPGGEEPVTPGEGELSGPKRIESRKLDIDTWMRLKDALKQTANRYNFIPLSIVLAVLAFLVVFFEINMSILTAAGYFVLANLFRIFFWIGLFIAIVDLFLTDFSLESIAIVITYLLILAARYYAFNTKREWRRKDNSRE